MKNIYLAILFIPFLGFTQVDTTINSKYEITSINQKGINQLISKYKKTLKEKNGVNGWRLQIKFTSKREDILPYQIRFNELYPDIPAQIRFDSPYYKLTVGNFRKKNDALKTKHKIEKEFPGSHPVGIIIDPKLFKD